MKILTKLIFILGLAVCAAACSFDDDQVYSATYTIDTTFEYNNATVFRADSLFFDRQTGLGIGWQDLGFYHKLDEAKTEFQGGFILSRLKGSGESENDRFRVNSGTGMNKSSNYLVYYSNPDPSAMPANDIEFTSAKIGTCFMVGCYVNNTKEVLNAVRNTFEVGDRLVIKMTGYLNKQKTGEQEFVLAERTETKDSLVTAWSPFKLDKLGNVDIIDIDIISTKDGIPAAFCLDDMVAKVAIAY